MTFVVWMWFCKVCKGHGIKRHSTTRCPGCNEEGVLEWRPGELCPVDEDEWWRPTKREARKVEKRKKQQRRKKPKQDGTGSIW